MYDSVTQGIHTSGFYSLSHDELFSSSTLLSYTSTLLHYYTSTLLFYTLFRVRERGTTKQCQWCVSKCVWEALSDFNQTFSGNIIHRARQEVRLFQCTSSHTGNNSKMILYPQFFLLSPHCSSLGLHETIYNLSCVFIVNVAAVTWLTCLRCVSLHPKP